MALHLQENIYAHYLVYRRSPRWLDLTPAQKEQGAAELAALLQERADQVEVRGVYSAAGLRPDADLVLWLLSNRIEATQDLAVAVRRTVLGPALELSWSFWGVTRPAEFSPDHAPAFQRGLPPLAWVCVYPFVRTPEWYLLPREERAQMLREHGGMGREFPQVQTNTVNAFGLGDYEWILCFEAEDPNHFVDMVRRLREAQARRYTKLETPFIVARRKHLAEALADLG